MSNDKPRYFSRPAGSGKPLGFWQMVVIVMATHLGVRPKAARENDFQRANGLQLFIVGLCYFGLLLLGLVSLVRYLAG